MPKKPTPSKKTTAVEPAATPAARAVAKKPAQTKAVTPAVKKTTAVTPKAKGTKTVAATSALVEQYRNHKGDTGSTEVQIVLLTDQIQSLSKHLATHAKDHDSRRGLLMMVGKRRRLLNYLALSDEKTYQQLIADLKLRK